MAPHQHFAEVMQKRCRVNQSGMWIGSMDGEGQRELGATIRPLKYGGQANPCLPGCPSGDPPTHGCVPNAWKNGVTPIMTIAAGHRFGRRDDA